MTIGANYNTWISNPKNAQSTFRYANNHEDCKQGALKLAQSRISLVDINKNKGMDINEFAREQHRLFRGYSIQPTNLFEKADVNRDGVLDAEELATTYLVADYLDGQIDGEIGYLEALQGSSAVMEAFSGMSPQDFWEIKNGWYPTQTQEIAQQQATSSAPNQPDDMCLPAPAPEAAPAEAPAEDGPATSIEDILLMQ